MPKPFDATLKHLLEAYARDCLDYVGPAHARRVSVINADLSTVTAAADKVLRITAPVPWLMHLEFQAGYDAYLGRRLLRYNVLLNGRHSLPVKSVVVLLRPKADGREMTGEVRYDLPDEPGYLTFRYHVVRAWQKPVAAVLAGGLGTLPLAPLSAVSREALPGVIRRMEERFRRETTPEEAATLWTATYVLMGLRYPKAFAAQLLQEVQAMKESVTYQAIIAEGRAQEAQRILLRQGRKRFGPPEAATRMAIEAIANVKRLEELSDRLLDVSSWEELLAGLPSRRRNGRRTKGP